MWVRTSFGGFQMGWVAVLAAAAVVVAGCGSTPGSLEPDSSTPDAMVTPDAATEVCGDGIQSGTETCDDGNVDDGDSCSSDCQAANCLVPVTHATVQAGIDDTACTTLWVQPGTYTENVTIARDIVVEGVGAAPVVLDGNAAETTVTIGSGTVEIRRATITGGLAEIGGGIHNAGDLTLIDAIVTGNTAAGKVAQGGGIYSTGTLHLAATRVHGNAVEAQMPDADIPIISGGGVATLGGTLQLTGGSVIDDNAVTGTFPYVRGLGGGVHSSGTTITLEDASAVKNNSIALDGAGTYSRATGGGIFMTQGDVTLTGQSAIDGNTASATGSLEASASGGGLYIENGSVSVTDGGSVSGNTATATTPGAATATAGGILLAASSVLFADATANDNSAEATVGGSSTAALKPEISMGEGGPRAIAKGGLLLSTFHLPGDTASFTNSAISGNSTTANGGVAGTGDAQGGALYLSASDPFTVTIEGCTVSDNRASSDDNAAGGVAYMFTGTGTSRVTLDVIGSTVSGNSAVAETGSAQGGVVKATASTGDATTIFTATNTTLSGNSARSTSGSARGGVVFANSSTGDSVTRFIATNTTLSGNSASSTTGSASGGAIRVSTSTGGAITEVNLRSATLTANTAEGATGATGGAIYMLQGASVSIARGELGNTLIYGNTATTSPDCHTTSEASLTSLDYNLVGDVTGCDITGATDNNILDTDPVIGPLANNGGPTETHALDAASPAVDAGNPGGCTSAIDGSSLATDQRGELRSAGGRCDIGAYEYIP